MKVYRALFLLMFTILILSGCGAVEAIFKAGMWWAFFLVGIVIVLLLVIASRYRKK